MFYRIAKAYFKWDGQDGITAIITVSLCQSLIIMDIIFVIIRLLYPRQETLGIGNIGKVVVIASLVIIIFANFIRYKNRYDDYKLIWSSEKPSRKRINGFLVILSLILPLVIAIMFGRIQL